MAILVNTRSDEKTHLRQHHTFGRFSDQVDTVLDGSTVSRLHAAIEWQEPHWFVKDLSKNGTWYNGKRFLAGERIQLELNSELVFGDPDNVPYRVEDLSAPNSMLLPMDSKNEAIALELFSLLPENNPTHAIYYSVVSQTWNCDEVDSPLVDQRLFHNQIVDLDGVSYRAFLVETDSLTDPYQNDEHMLGNLKFMFDLSLDEEVTQLQIEFGNQIHDLGERTHHYLLMHLARIRAESAAQGLDEKSQGWIDNELLSRQLGIEGPHLNILIFRARKQITDRLMMPIESSRLVERRKGRVRFGNTNFKIYKGASLEYEMHPMA